MSVRRAWSEWSAMDAQLAVTRDFLSRVDQILSVVDKMELAGEMARTEARLFRIEKATKAADLALLDLAKTATIRDEEQVTKSRWSPWHGVTLTGWPTHTWVGGRLVFAEGRIDEAVRGTEARYDHSRGGYWGTA